MFQPGDECAVALSRFAGFRVEQEFRHQKQTQPLGTWSSALGPGQHQVHDVLEQVIGVAVGNKPLDAFDVPGAIALIDRFGAASADVGTRVGLGEHHGGTPVALDRQRGPMPLLLIADAVEDVRHKRTGHEHEHRRVGAEDQLVDRPLHHRRRWHTADVFGEPDSEPLTISPRAERLLERLRQAHDVRVGVERRWVAVAVGKRLGHRALSQPGGLGKHLPHRIAVQVAERFVGQHLLQAERFEQIEFQVAHIALVVAHGSRLPRSAGPSLTRLAPLESGLAPLDERLHALGGVGGGEQGGHLRS